MRTRDEMQAVIEARTFKEPNSGCWLWEGACDGHGHARVRHCGTLAHAHRVSYETYRGPIPKGLWVLHKCDTRCCVNPNHLFLGDALLNARDRAIKGRAKRWEKTYTAVGTHSTYERPTPSAPFALTQEGVKAILRYFPETGVFIWRARQDRDLSWNSKHANKEAGAVLPNGYRYIRIENRLYLAHRLAWLYMVGEQPAGQVDHKDRDRANNRWDNLRSATQPENSANQGLRSTNTSGAKGVSPDKRRGGWRADITLNNKRIALGRFDRLDDAIAARRAAEIQYHGSFAVRKDKVN